MVPESLRFKLIPIALSGLLPTAAFPGPQVYPLAFVALVPLLLVVQGSTPRAAFQLGLAWGLIHFTSLLYWIVPTLNTFGGLAWPLSLACLVLLSLYLALYPALFCGLVSLGKLPAALRPLAAAALWTGLEFIRAHAFTGFPWGTLGYSQAPNLALIQMTEFTGVLGVSFVIVLCNAALAEIIQFVKQRAMAPTLGGLGVLTAILLSLHAWGAHRMDTLAAQIKATPTTRIALVQGSVPQEHKWDENFKKATLETYRRLSLEAAAQTPDLTIWPETALPFYYGQDALPTLAVDNIVKEMQGPLFTGSPAVAVEENTILYFNRAYMIAPPGLIKSSYDKTHLVPFGEYVPLESILGFLGKLVQSAGNFSPGKTEFSPLAYGDHSTGILICFEILFPEISRTFVKNGANILTTMTNDAWFGTTAAPGQHFAIAVLRAVENRRSLARAANTGISGFIDPLGRAHKATSLFSETQVVQDLPILSEISLYTRLGDLFAWACLIAIFPYFMIKVRQNILRRHQP